MKKSVKRNRRAIIVLGMHRSGTSALARTVNLCGVDLGNNLIPPEANNNEKGFWEHIDINQINEKLLHDLNSSWDDVRSLPEGWRDSHAAQRYKLEIISILERNFAESRFWGVKDPRICRFLSVWRPLLEQTGSKPYFLIIVRNPLEVAASLAKRDGFSKGKSCLLWLKHLIESEKGTRNSSRIFVTYEELLSDWKGLMSRVQRFFRFRWPNTLKKAGPEIDAFLENSLRHSRVTDSVLIKDKSLSKWIKDAYLATTDTIPNGDGRLIKTLDAIENELKETAILYESAFTDIWKKYLDNNYRLQERNQQVNDIKNRIDELSQEKRYLQSSIDQLQTYVKERNEHNAQLTERDETVERLSAQLAERDAQLAKQEVMIQELMKSIASIYVSKSWRITSPMRFVGHLWRSIFMRHKKNLSLQDSERKSGQHNNINQEYQSSNHPFSLTRKNRDWHAWRGRIKYRLAAYPWTYERVSKIYRLVFRSYPTAMSAPEKNTFSRQFISKAQGLVNITDTESGEIIHPAHSFLARYEEDQDFSGHVTDIKAIAYYLPQFHAIPENDKWWGEGFTEWMNTRKTKPLFPGHYQPREPHDDIGYYDLSDIEVIKKQVELAKKHGIYGFCFYHYWFHGKRLLGKPIDLLLNHPEIDMPFCLCWANETWSKKWDGRDHHILMEQTFSPEDDLHFISFLKPYMMDSRYIRVDGKPMLLVYRISKFPKPLSTVQRWRKWCRENGVGEIHLVAVCHGEVYPHMPLGEVGFDAYVAFPPHGFSCQHIPSDKDTFGTGYRFDYASGVESYSFSEEEATIYEGCTLGWDNTPRFGKNANIYMNFSLDSYGSWLRRAMEFTRTRFKPEERYLFINAWNEWAEGTYLEPDKKYGYSYINTTSRVLFGISDTGTDGGALDSADRYTQDYAWLKSLIESRGEHALSMVAQFIKPDSEILEFGSSSGYFTRFLREERNAIIDIVELDRACAERAARYARDSYVGDIEQGRWKDVYAGRRYDVILFADVLEHLRDPWCVLREVVEFVRKGGRIILSVPNIAHAQILSSLYNDDFSYAQVGILDKTHLRFFTEQTVRQMVEDCGLQVCELIPVNAKILPKGCGTLWNHSDVPVKLKKMLSSKPNAHAIQFVLCCTLIKGDGINDRGLHASSIE